MNTSSTSQILPPNEISIDFKTVSVWWLFDAFPIRAICLGVRSPPKTMMSPALSKSDGRVKSRPWLRVRSWWYFVFSIAGISLSTIAGVDDVLNPLVISFHLWHN